MISDMNKSMLMSAMKNLGVFVSAGYEHPNVMVTHNGCCGTLWNKQVFILPVRREKFTSKILDECGSFAINVPCRDMRKELAECSKLSGFSVNKFDELHLCPKRAKAIKGVVLGNCGLIVECKVIAKIDPSAIEQSFFDTYYGEKTPHTLYFGEIVNSYILNK